MPTLVGCAGALLMLGTTMHSELRRPIWNSSLARVLDLDPEPS